MRRFSLCSRNPVLVKRKQSELPDGVIFHEDIDLLVWRPVGIVTESVVNTILAYLHRQETAHSRPFDRFTDTSAQEAMELNPEYVFQVALYRRMIFVGRPPAKSAFYVVNPQIAELLRIHANVTNHSPLQVAIFEQYEAAATWLGAPLTRLRPSAHNLMGE